MTLEPQISVVMPIHDNPDAVRVTLPAILKQTLPDGLMHEVVAVDDGSGPEIADLLERLAQAGLTVIRLGQNRGRAAARNAGIAAARGRWLVLLDSDMIVRSDFLAAHAETLAAGAQISLGRFVDTDCTTPADSRPLPIALPGACSFTSANVALDRPLLDAVAGRDGPFDSGTFVRYGWEDTDLGLRLARMRAKQRSTPRAVGFHLVPPFSLDLLPGMIGKEIDRAAMARRLLAKHPLLSVRMVTQTTPLHRAAWEALTLFGLVNEQRLRPIIGWLVRNDFRRLATVLVRNLILNPAYVRHL